MTQTIPSEFRRGWPVVLACAVGMALGISALPFYTLGVFAKPMIAEFGWSRGDYQGAFLCMLAGALVAPLTGAWCDRFGVRPVALVSLAGFAGGLALIGLMTTANIWTLYAAWIIMALVSQATGPIAWTRAISNWFYRKRGLAIGIALMGSGFTAFAGPPIANALIEAIGWRWTYVAFGAGVLVIAGPILWLLLKDAPDEVKAAGRALGGGLSEAHGVELAEALRNFRFWVIAGAFFLVSAGVAGIVTSLVPLLTDRGIDAGTAAGYAALIGLSVIAGRLIGGYLLDRFWGPGVGCILMALPALSCLVLMGDTLSPALLVIAVVLVGFAGGAEFDMIAYFVGRYFGLKHYGKIYGTQYIIVFFGAGLAPLVFGRVYDAWQSYTPILIAMVGAFGLSGLLLLTLGRYPDLARETADG